MQKCLLHHKYVRFCHVNLLPIITSKYLVQFIYIFNSSMINYQFIFTLSAVKLLVPLTNDFYSRTG